jgi:hypothetical protein
MLLIGEVQYVSQSPEAQMIGSRHTVHPASTLPCEMDRAIDGQQCISRDLNDPIIMPLQRRHLLSLRTSLKTLL